MEEDVAADLAAMGGEEGHVVLMVVVAVVLTGLSWLIEAAVLYPLDTLYC